MARVKRSEMEKRRIGFPSDSERLEVLEEVVLNMAPAGPARDKLEALIGKMDQMDIDHPDPR